MHTFKKAHDPLAYLARLAVAYDDATEDTTEETPEAPAEDETFTIPEDFSGLSDDELNALRTEALEHFDTIYGDGDISDEGLETLSSLTDGIDAVNAEINTRTEAATERSEKAAALAARVKPEETEAPAEAEAEEATEDASEEGEGSGEEASTSSEEAPAEEKELVTASAKRKPVSLNLSAIRNRNKGKAPSPKNQTQAPTQMSDLVSDGSGEGTNWAGMAEGFDRRLASFNANQYGMANSRGQHLREQHSLGVFHKPIPQDLMVASGDVNEIDAVMSRAVDQTRLEGNSLVAAGGWCAPSQTLYDFLELETRDGLVSVPEFGVTRGGIQFTQGPLFSDIYSAVGFSFTEEDDIAGEYGGPGGNKPFYKIECPEFTEERLDVDGLYLTAGILQQRGYPEIIARTLRGAMVAHDHKMSANTIAKMVAGSTSITMPTPVSGTVAPLLNSIELQVQHYRYTHRLGLNSTLEGIFPAWLQGAVRADLARRDGLDVLSVTDQQVVAWFRQRGIAPQFVVDWQALDSVEPGEFVSWPESVEFLLYVAGTWARGTSDIITLDTIYDSVNLGQNDYIALFTEEGSLMAKRGHDSRVVTVGLESSGSVGARVLVGHDGVPVVPADETP